MQADEGLARVIAALGSDDFADALFEWLREAFRADNVSVLAYRGDRPPEVLFSSVRDHRMNRHLNEVYASGIYRLDPFYDLHLKGAPSGVYHLRAIAPDRFEGNAYYLQFYRQSGMVDELAFVARPAPDISVHMCLSRAERPFSLRDLRRAEPVAPVVVALMEQNWRSITSGFGTRLEQASLSDQLRKTLAERDGISLTPRQAEVAILILRGHSTMSVSLQLEISPQTVKVFRKQIYNRCNISSQSELFSLLMPHLGRHLGAQGVIAQGA